MIERRLPDGRTVFVRTDNAEAADTAIRRLLARESLLGVQVGGEKPGDRQRKGAFSPQPGPVPGQARPRSISAPASPTKKAATQDNRIARRADFLPLAVQENGDIVPAIPGMILDPVVNFGRVATGQIDIEDLTGQQRLGMALISPGSLASRVLTKKAPRGLAAMSRALKRQGPGADAGLFRALKQEGARPSGILAERGRGLVSARFGPNSRLPLEENIADLAGRSGRDLLKRAVAASPAARKVAEDRLMTRQIGRNQPIGFQDNRKTQLRSSRRQALGSQREQIMDAVERAFLIKTFDPKGIQSHDALRKAHQFGRDALELARINGVEFVDQQFSSLSTKAERRAARAGLSKRIRSTLGDEIGDGDLTDLFRKENTRGVVERFLPRSSSRTQPGRQLADVLQRTSRQNQTLNTVRTAQPTSSAGLGVLRELAARVSLSGAAGQAADNVAVSLIGKFGIRKRTALQLAKMLTDPDQVVPAMRRLERRFGRPGVAGILSEAEKQVTDTILRLGGNLGRAALVKLGTDTVPPALQRGRERQQSLPGIDLPDNSFITDQNGQEYLIRGGRAFKLPENLI